MAQKAFEVFTKLSADIGRCVLVFADSPEEATSELLEVYPTINVLHIREMTEVTDQRIGRMLRAPRNQKLMDNKKILFTKKAKGNFKDSFDEIDRKNARKKAKKDQ
jgi:hypothetical protein